ncbi:MAG TPA: molybdopterin-guanine dinucleotide biosynthesis protein B, partial [Usitatibacteraceae bacterium]|nr:molybdopterin-guanine dinucleotide biosynthesis protein B [Usitatibacteraceae bacterium]
KTTLIEKVIPQLVIEGFKVSLIKHAHHEFDIDQPGKDSHRHREAGASEVLVASSNRWVLMHELRGAAEPTLEEQLKRFAPCDVVIVEGWKFNAIPKIEVHRKLNNKPLLFPGDATVVAVATDESLATSLPCFDLDDGEAVANFIIEHLGLRKPSLQRVK